MPRPKRRSALECIVSLQRRASFQTRKGRCNILNLRIVLSENRFRFSGRCASECPSSGPARNNG
ncbi:hypothetical protein GFL39_08995 [Rhizobium leguminosarum bv. viciae]|nr:hypothetical protein [Rhizobium leguminosarum bv. viciae]NKK79199.1 hypothetical protein [Rhizobium leguminosarum bv. viciae]NKL05096.1 hypothetical protein [Rhizobium leguminosarum bv. viciae]NKL81454.1 hypothetical protein [Rhizobium leguminosarum bv. viciae]NKL91125.1 hypothetical protein [Rhizobium leguminosarum bv. viciae]